MNKAQLQSLKRIYQRWDNINQSMSFLSFRRSASEGVGGGYFLVSVGSMVIGIEPDGYTHT